MAQPQPLQFSLWDRVTCTVHKVLKLLLGDNSIVDVDVAGRQGTINHIIGNETGRYYRIAIDIRDHEIIPVQALKRGLLEVCLTPSQIDLLKYEMNGASCVGGVVYLRPLPNFDIYRLMYMGSFKSAWDPVTQQYKITLEMRCAAGSPLIGELCGEKYIPGTPVLRMEISPKYKLNPHCDVRVNEGLAFYQALIELGPERARGAHACLPSLKREEIEVMTRTAIHNADLCYNCGCDNCTELRCAPSPEDMAPWFRVMQDAISAGRDIPSGLSREMDDKCVFVNGLKPVLLRLNAARIEAELMTLARAQTPNPRVVVRGDLGHAFIFFGKKLPYGSLHECDWDTSI